MLRSYAKFVPGMSQCSQTHWAHLTLPLLVASGVPPDVEGGILPSGRKRGGFCEWWGFQRLLCRTILSAGQDARLYGRPEASRYGGTAPRRILSHFDKTGRDAANDFGGSNPGKLAAWVRFPAARVK